MSDTPESIAARAYPSSAGGDFDAQNAAPATRERRRWWRVLLWSLAGLLALLLTTLGGVWIWAGSEGSLATALRWAGAERPLVTDEVTGTVRGGGKVRRLVWDEGGLRVEVHDAEILWTPAALLSRTLQIDHLSASRILIDDQRPKAEAAAGPPTSLALPLNIRVKALRALARIRCVKYGTAAQQLHRRHRDGKILFCNARGLDHRLLLPAVVGRVQQLRDDQRPQLAVAIARHEVLIQQIDSQRTQRQRRQPSIAKPEWVILKGERRADGKWRRQAALQTIRQRLGRGYRLLAIRCPKQAKTVRRVEARNLLRIKRRHFGDDMTESTRRAQAIGKQCGSFGHTRASTRIPHPGVRRPDQKDHPVAYDRRELLNRGLGEHVAFGLRQQRQEVAL